ncbi:MAG: hypothetical protein C7B45_08020 [Sulfobacillus acidophilus]|uniref:Uncharacterized protein n=1 Tax=Sulfobacillus acidophilus TaxID=53633 RepID=A0A2T2WIU0_9FIRM|nr:MAG: hypothetical protein C7B45_08020 [Sulfobacillus acidophilus]
MNTDHCRFPQDTGPRVVRYRCEPGKARPAGVARDLSVGPAYTIFLWLDFSAYQTIRMAAGQHVHWLAAPHVAGTLSSITIDGAGLALHLSAAGED